MTRVSEPQATMSAKRPRNALAGMYGHPTHPIAVTIPIGSWIASLVFDIASHTAENGEAFARGAQLLIAIGIVGALIAAVTGLMDLLAIPSGTKAFRTGLTHMTLNTVVLLAFVANFAWRAGSDDTTRPTPAGPLVLTIISLLVLGASGYLGGKLAYRFGVRVADEGTQAEGIQRV